MYELDVFRGCAVLAVMLYHYTSRYDELFGHKKENYVLNFDYGFLGVHLFFIISGFVIFMTVERCKSIRDFAYKRASRLFPAYIPAVILTFVSVAIYQLEGRVVSVFDAVINLTLIQGLIPGSIAYVDGAYWSLTVEIMFYFIMGLFLMLGMIKNIQYPIVIWLFFSVIIRGLDIYYDHFILNALNYYGILQFCNLFIAGIVFYKIKKTNNKLYHLMIGLCLIPEFLFNGVLIGSIVTIFFLFFYLLVYGKLEVLNRKSLAFFGTISYALYLVHQNIGYIIINFLEGKGLTHELFILIPIGISLFIASILTFYVEQPIIKILRNRNSSNKTTSNPYSRKKLYEQ